MNASREMPRYQSVKKVWALEIDHVEGDTIHFKDPGYAAVKADDNMFARYTPAPGDFLVVYEGDGYKSISPRKAFLDGHKPIG